MSKRDDNPNQVIVRCAVEDDKFVHRLIADPVQVLQDALGLRIRKATITKQHGELLQRLLVKAKDDAAFRKQLFSDPEKALSGLGYEQAKVLTGGDVKKECHLWSLIDYMEW